MKDIDRYKHEEFNGLTYFCRAFDSFMKETMRCRDFDRLHHWQTSTLYFPWRSKDNNFDCGVYAIKTMELYDGQNTNHAALVDLKGYDYFIVFREYFACYISVFESFLIEKGMIAS
ncbi:uncharacterized protein LOC130590620 [Beta vulgaris subsp. vulgaris]|uniref:uncharacterized protein LOC130590620 n=1 Tax=Beta vulgaris subsp. vulgaris TaxID=3555 RepID=UPI0025489A89|nr:uncharacterized protein LOC130590620 [Beta vulgaris subsp. vulgaris]